MLHLFAATYFSVKNILVQTSKQIGRRNMFVAAIFLGAKKMLITMEIQFSCGQTRYNTVYFDIEQAHKKILPFVMQTVKATRTPWIHSRSCAGLSNPFYAHFTQN